MHKLDRDAQEAGVKDLNQKYRRYEQVNKDQAYHFSEQQEGEQFDEAFEIKTCDFSQWLSEDPEKMHAFANDFGAALEEIGFAILINHGVDAALYETCEHLVRDFFETIPMADRMPYHAKRHGSVNQGYFPIKETSIIHPDLVEGWVFCRRAMNLDNDPNYNAHDFWPDPSYEEKFRPLVLAHQALFQPIMQSILTYLNCDPHLYDEKLAKTNFGFRLNYYPALKNDLEGATGGRMLGHEDVDLFTILPASSQEGLQVLNRRNMKWIRLKAPKGALIINTGDYMQRITNDRLPSTTHRVAQPVTAQSRSEPRISLPIAVYVWEDELLEVLPGLGEAKYAPIQAEDFHTRITSKYYGDDYRPEDQATDK